MRLLLVALALAAAPTPPTLSPGSVLRPAFTLADGKSFEAGVAFAADWNGETLVLSATHIFGPPGGLAEAIPPEKLASTVKSVRFTEAWTHEKVGGERVVVTVPGAHVMGADATGDLSVFRTPPSLDRLAGPAVTPLVPLTLAAADPKVGDVVWLAGPVVGDTAPLHSAKVVEVKPGFLFYAFDAPVDLTATSGSPLIDTKGQVVGIHLGGGLSDGKTIGAAGPVTAIRKNVTAAMGS